ncbi:TetR/AcrR family transcriptional regulator [Nocardia uniformis]|uniref:TetR/AcrR family transcriptional regulator n=1 Tax=Nocardia uniformis TaxID=53432 RepID=A0A849CBU9_9NOCA|nr:TetR/AcrR family transcriptional regulator [Nocardia uniformis]NNH70441.1 TetR/AcrR family transcriptional regulator [Nocardia uniformis]
MARPAKNPGNGSRDRILAAAAAVLSEKGYSATRLTDIAEVAQLRAPAVYYYFDSREALVAEVMIVGQQWVRRHVTEALDALPPGIPALDRLCVAVDAHLRVELELSDFATAVTRNAGQLPAELRAQVGRESAEYHAIWRGLIADGQSDGSIRTDIDPRSARMLIIGALNWAPEWWRATRQSIDVLIGTAQSFIRAGLTEH